MAKKSAPLWPRSKVVDDVKTYVIHKSDYMDDAPTMAAFKGTWRALLVHLVQGSSYWDDQDDADDSATLASKSDKALAADVEMANGAGQPYTTVWCVEDAKQVIG